MTHQQNIYFCIEAQTHRAVQTFTDSTKYTTQPASDSELEATSSHSSTSTSLSMSLTVGGCAYYVDHVHWQLIVSAGTSSFQADSEWWEDLMYYVYMYLHLAQPTTQI